MLAVVGWAFISATFAIYKQLPGNDLLVNENRRYHDVWLIVLALFSMEAEGYQNIFRGASAGNERNILLSLNLLKMKTRQTWTGLLDRWLLPFGSELPFRSEGINHQPGIGAGHRNVGGRCELHQGFLFSFLLLRGKLMCYRFLQDLVGLVTQL